MDALNEPSRIECGAPDFIISYQKVPIGYIECKDVDSKLDLVETSGQLMRYRESLPNLILTNYLEFRWYRSGESRQTARIGHIDDDQKKIIFDKDGIETVGRLFESFFMAEPLRIGDSRELVKIMAAKARLLKEAIMTILEQADKTNYLIKMFESYKTVLLSRLSEADFADMQAQTAVYGLFAARYRHDDESPFTRKSAFFTETTPFLQDVFGRIAGPKTDEKIAWIIDDLALLLRHADMAAIMEKFGRYTREEDPIIHFYETFLADYDPKRRKGHGVYYTPEPVVSYIVRSVDRLLQERFFIKDGLADAAKTTDGVHRVLILDPAVGTGNFLREAIVRIHEKIKAKGLEGVWPDYIESELLPRLFGFEVLMAPYAICHLRLALDVGPLNGDQRLGVFLTNALEKSHEGAYGILFAEEIVSEAKGADSVKRDQPVMVVIGNPPYSGDSENNREWIKKLLRGDDNKKGSYFHIDGKPINEKNLKGLNDDYVKFVRFAQWRIEQTGEGVIGFVTNHAYLDNPTFRAMRYSLLQTFDEIYVLDLHGNAKKMERAPDGGKDENVFDIQQGVAISLFIKFSKKTDSLARVFHSDLWGERKEGDDGGKYGWLAANDVFSTDWTELSPRPPFYLFVPRDESLREEWEAGVKVTDVFPTYSVGIIAGRDKLAMQWSKEEMLRVVNTFDLFRGKTEEAREFFMLGPDSGKNWKVHLAQKDIQNNFDRDRCIRPILYRPFDIRYTCYTGKSGGFLSRPCFEVMRHMLAGENVGLICSRQQSQSNTWSLCGVTENIIEKCVISNKTKEGNYLFPLYLYPLQASNQKEAPDNVAKHSLNLNPNLISTLQTLLQLTWIPDRNGDLLSTFGPEDVFHYIYAVLHSPTYRSRYATFLKYDFPRIPLTPNPSLFAKLSKTGHRLVSLHLMRDDDSPKPAFPCPGNNQVQKVLYSSNDNGRVWINNDQYFQGIAPETWNFSVGGYQPAEKWLKDRKGRVLSYLDITHYCQMCAALAESRRIMSDIDALIEQHGGWPLAPKP